MLRTVLSGTRSRSSSVITTYWSDAHSKPRTVSPREMTSSSTGQYVFIWIRLRSLPWSMWKLMPLVSVATYSLTGIVTRPNWMAPFHIARGMRRPRAWAEWCTFVHGARAGDDSRHRRAWQGPCGRSCSRAGIGTATRRGAPFEVLSCWGPGRGPGSVWAALAMLVLALALVLG